jgi:hypothetical protein
LPIIFPARYNNGIDYSTISRLSFFSNQVEAISNLTVREFILGSGINSSKQLGSTFNLEEVDQHNDFFTIFYDSGIVVLLLLLRKIKKLSNSAMTLSLVCVYLFSFYHNMGYDVFLISLIFLSFTYSTKCENGSVKLL